MIQFITSNNKTWLLTSIIDYNSNNLKIFRNPFEGTFQNLFNFQNLRSFCRESKTLSKIIIIFVQVHKLNIYTSPRERIFFKTPSPSENSILASYSFHKFFFSSRGPLEFSTLSVEGGGCGNFLECHNF